MDEDHALPHKPQAPRVRVERRGLLVGRSSSRQPERMEPFVFGQSAMPGASSGGGGAGGKLNSNKPYALRRYSSGLRTEAVVSEAEPITNQSMARGEGAKIPVPSNQH